jgi:hypothetical protein
MREVEMDHLTYDIYLREAWAVVSVLTVMDLEAMWLEARARRCDPDVRLIESLLKLRAEEHNSPCHCGMENSA